MFTVVVVVVVVVEVEVAALVALVALVVVVVVGVADDVSEFARVLVDDSGGPVLIEGTSWRVVLVLLDKASGDGGGGRLATGSTTGS